MGTRPQWCAFVCKKVTWNINDFVPPLVEWDFLPPSLLYTLVVSCNDLDWNNWSTLSWAKSMECCGEMERDCFKEPWPAWIVHVLSFKLHIWLPLAHKQHHPGSTWNFVGGWQIFERVWGLTGGRKFYICNKSGSVGTMPPSLAGKANVLHILSLGGGWPVSIGMSFDLIVGSSRHVFIHT